VATPGIFIWGGGYSPGNLGTEVPQWVQGQSPSRGSARRNSPEAEAVYRHCLQVLTAETINI